MTINFNETIYFFLAPQGPPENSRYSHLAICLAEGFKKIGIKFYGNTNYWKVSPTDDYLFKNDPDISPDDCSIVIISHPWFVECKWPFPEHLFHENRTYTTVYLDAADKSWTHSWHKNFRQFDFIFKAHHNRKCKYPPNVFPWSFGLSNRILEELTVLPTWSDRDKHLLVNFRCDHGLRLTIAKTFLPLLDKCLTVETSVDSFSAPPSDPYHYLQWAQSGRRHYPEYYERLKRTMACAAFGGNFVPPWPMNQSSPVNRIQYRLLNKFRLLKSKRILQWDSWRLWESFAAGCATFHVDFEEYGLQLPVMPQNWNHYIGINLNYAQESIERLSNDPSLFEKIAASGRDWAIENYSPEATALRFLQTIRNL